MLASVLEWEHISRTTSHGTNGFSPPKLPIPEAGPNVNSHIPIWCSTTHAHTTPNKLSSFRRTFLAVKTFLVLTWLLGGTKLSRTCRISFSDAIIWFWKLFILERLDGKNNGEVNDGACLDLGGLSKRSNLATSVALTISVGMLICLYSNSVVDRVNWVKRDLSPCRKSCTCCCWRAQATVSRSYICMQIVQVSRYIVKRVSSLRCGGGAGGAEKDGQQPWTGQFGNSISMILERIFYIQ